jgi:hypothetical protein
MEMPNHGKINCSICFNNCNVRKINKWKIKKDPGHWGSTNPRILILGFSKGATQENIYEKGIFEDVAFGGKQCRSNLTKILQAVNLLKKTETIDEKINKNEKEYAFASLIRCSVSKEMNGKYLTSGSLITQSFREIPEIISNCTNTYLAKMPCRLSIVIMLGINDSYIKECKEIIKRINPNKFKEINNVSYLQNNIIFVHLTHPSPGNGHMKNWISGIGNIGNKKRNAEKAIKEKNKKS